MAAIAESRRTLEVPLYDSRPTTPGDDIHDMAEPVFDHHSYPELIDAILEYSPPESLLVFRGTDRHYRGRVDDMLFEHVIVRPPMAEGKGKGKDISTQPGLPGFQLLASRPPYHRLPLLPYDPSDALDRWVLNDREGDRPEVDAASQSREDCREDIAGRIRVVDLYGRPPVSFPFNEALMDLEILRRPAVWTKHDDIAFAPIVVDFVDLSICPPQMDGVLHFNPGCGVTRHVVHVGVLPEGGDTAYSAFTYAEPQERRDLVLVFTVRPASGSGPANATDGKKFLTDKDVFWEFTELARCTMIAGGTVTFVGLGTIDLGDDSDEVGTKFETHLKDSLDHQGLTPGGETLENAMARLSFLTNEEWRAALPEENVEFEAEWPTYTYTE